MIKKLKIKVIILSMVSLLALLSVILITMNLINYNSVVKEADVVLEILSKNKGDFPLEMKDRFGLAENGGTKPEGDMEKPEIAIPNNMSPEIAFESRFFSIFFDEDGNVKESDITQIASVNYVKAVKYARKAIEKGKTEGFIEDYRYLITSDEAGSHVVFLDCGRKLDAFFTFMWTSIIISLIGYAIVSAILIVLSGKITKPIAESYYKQRQFITDAGHELKTPLTIINANVDILEMEVGENESLQDITKQTRRLRTLTEELVLLSRMEEKEESLIREKISLSDLVNEAANPYEAIAANDNKKFALDIEDDIEIKGNKQSIEKLIYILLDNAFKYSNEGGNIEFNLLKLGKNAVISLENTTAFKVDSEQLNHVFDRFYRTDSSRNSETGGHGIGLSIAKAIVNANGGKIQASSKDENSFLIQASFPL